MQIHHGHKHGEKLPNQTCKGCGSEFYDPKSRLEFCDDCNPNAGENNGNWKGAKQTGTCQICGSEFSFYPSDKEGLYCSACVESADGLLPENPATRECISTSCAFCGESIETHPSRAENRKRGVFCDLDCYGAWLSENVVHENHYQWEGGTLDYGQEWWRVRRKALERDDYTCQNCVKRKEKSAGIPTFITSNEFVASIHHRRPTPWRTS